MNGRVVVGWPARGVAQVGTLGSLPMCPAQGAIRRTPIVQEPLPATAAPVESKATQSRPPREIDQLVMLHFDGVAIDFLELRAPCMSRQAAHISASNGR